MRRARRLRLRRILAQALGWGYLVVVGLAGFAPERATAQRVVEVIDTPSLQGHVDLARTRLNAPSGRLRTVVLLPEGYGEQPERRWPVLYLLHGVEDDSSTWLSPSSGDALRRLANVPAIVVLPEGGRSYWVDHWLGGERRGANWQRYLLEEVVPQIESRYRIQPGRQSHAIGGLSMGGYGALLAGAALPSYFGTVLAYSAPTDLSDPGNQYLVPFFVGISATRIWGRAGGPWALAHSPKALVSNLVDTRVLLTTGTGLPSPGEPITVDTPGEVAIEASAIWEASKFVLAARSARARSVRWILRPGIHNWASWRRDLSRSEQWGIFAPPPASAAPARFTYRTMSVVGNAWGLGFRFAEPPARVMVLRREGRTLSATGSGTVTITPGAPAADASGAGVRSDCAFTATLPFSRTLPEECLAAST